MGRLHELLRHAVPQAKSRQGVSSVAALAEKLGTTRSTLQGAQNENNPAVIGVDLTLRLADAAGWGDQQKVELLDAWLVDRAGQNEVAGFCLEICREYAREREIAKKESAKSVLTAFARALERLDPSA